MLTLHYLAVLKNQQSTFIYKVVVVQITVCETTFSQKLLTFLSNVNNKHCHIPRAPKRKSKCHHTDVCSKVRFYKRWWQVSAGDLITTKQHTTERRQKIGNCSFRLHMYKTNPRNFKTCMWSCHFFHVNDGWNGRLLSTGKKISCCVKTL